MKQLQHIPTMGYEGLKKKILQWGTFEELIANKIDLPYGMTPELAKNLLKFKQERYSYDQLSFDEQ